MSLKTDYGYNEDDFVETQGGMQELTVTITLCEYRNLIRDICHQDTTIEKLQEENKKLNDQIANLSAYVVSQNPEMIQSLGNAVNSLFNKNEASAEETEGEG